MADDRFAVDREAFILPPGDYYYIGETMARTQARMTALVGKALDATIKDLGGIDLDGMSTADSPVECCNPTKVAEVFTGHLCSLLYPKQEPEVKT